MMDPVGKEIKAYISKYPDEMSKCNGQHRDIWKLKFFYKVLSSWDNVNIAFKCWFTLSAQFC